MMKYILLLFIGITFLNAQEKEPLIDKQQHLMWSVCSGSTTPDQPFLWRFGKSYCENSYKYGFSDWRLPTPKEIQQSIKNGTLKKIHSGSYWTSSVDPKDPEDNALSAYSSNGYIFSMDVCDGAYALCVR